MEFLVTWREIEERALYDPYLHAAVTAVRQGLVTREQAMMAVALVLSKQNAEWMERDRRRLAEQTVAFRDFMDAVRIDKTLSTIRQNHPEIFDTGLK